MLSLHRSIARSTLSPFGKRLYSSLLKQTTAATQPRTDWTKAEITELFNAPLISLVHHASIVHNRFHEPSEVQLCTLMNIKSGGCTEDCKYCAQSNRYSDNTGVKAEKVVTLDQVRQEAELAKRNGSTRFCMGAAWREMAGRKNAIKNLKQMIKIVDDLKMESCVTLGMIDKSQLTELKDAGLTAYNHNVDTSREYYPKVISTRSYDDRLKTISNVHASGVNVCSGGIVGMGETREDRISFLYTLSTLGQHPESVPINRLVPIKGTPLGDELLAEGKPLPFDEIVRTVAMARLLMPGSIIRLAAGRYTMKESEQVMCFMAGVNAIFTGKKMLTTMCNGWDEDKEMLQRWGLTPMRSFDRTTVDPTAAQQVEPSVSA
ncbi:biotin synthase [Nadsonia fulvescens var. elongata DSM 6958]|uniref:biotin synthase n=1 Tax=Nadsonia fulvescens var. elongata DSM 6958 TaxID=857566 RepID=A0A1E3PN82_9ASCO|nr:biotin synthase [Nadsonia fulvescens var. elongata DSM 6958]